MDADRPGAAKPSTECMRRLRAALYDQGLNYRGEPLRQPQHRTPDELRRLWKQDRRLYHKLYHGLNRRKNMNYPNSPGFKARDTETSEQAGRAVAVQARKLHDRLEAIFRQHREGLTHDEAAAKTWDGALNCAAFERHKTGVRSRCSELKKMGRIEALPLRRENPSGHKAVVWRHVDFAPPKSENRIQQELL